MKAVVFNIGCKVNQYECDVIMQSLEEKGYDVSCEMVFADLYILNTCAVTNEAERKSRQAIARCRHLNSKAKIMVCGCASKKNPKSFEKENVICIAGVYNKKDILNHIEDVDIIKNIEDNGFVCDNFNDILHKTNRTRAYVKIQDGCNCFCTYCIIPYLRGRSRSRNIDEIINEINELKNHTKEIVLTGINLMSYGLDLGTNLLELIKKMKNIDVRIRLGSFYVEGLNRELLKALFDLKQFCPHFHLSLQSGDNEVLKNMNRHYTTDMFKEKINLIRSFDNNAAITTDIIVGFPTETHEQFENTTNFVKEIGFSDIHIFPFSKREGTVAAKWECLPKQIIKQREEKLFEIKTDLRRKYLSDNIGVVQNVLFEDEYLGYKRGYSERYIRIYKKNGIYIEKVIPRGIFSDGLKGE